MCASVSYLAASVRLGNESSHTSDNTVIVTSAVDEAELVFLRSRAGNLSPETEIRRARIWLEYF